MMRYSTYRPKGAWASIVAAFAIACVFALASSSAAAATRFGGSGEEAGQLKGPSGVAVDNTIDPSSGDVYVADDGNHRVDKFDSAGHFLLAWGQNVVEGGHYGSGELQTCTTFCQEGQESGYVGFPTGVAVDNEASGPGHTQGDVYEVDYLHWRVQKFTPNGEFVLMFGGQVNETTHADVCLAGEKCTRGLAAKGTGNGEFSYMEYPSEPIAVGAGGQVYVGDRGRVQVFEPVSSAGKESIAWDRNISLAGLEPPGTVEPSEPTALAVDKTGDVFVKDRGVAGVREFEPGGALKATVFDAGSETVDSLAVDAAGDVFVGDSNGGFHVLKYDSAGNELASFGSVSVGGQNQGIAYSASGEQLYASATNEGAVWIVPSPPPGPVVESESANPEVRGAAMLKALVNTENSPTSYRFQYVSDTEFNKAVGGKACEWACAASTPPGTLAASFNDQPVTVSLPQATLVLGETYHYRLVATDALAHTTEGPGQSFEETPAALIEGPWVTGVSSTAATLEARVNPLGADTTYALEYDTREYKPGEASHGETLAGTVGAGKAYVHVERPIGGLQPATTYHYRLITSSATGTVEGPDLTFTTQLAVAGPLLPDERAWELVSPPDKHGASVAIQEGEGDIQAAALGDGIAYTASAPITEGAGSGSRSFVLSTRVPGGWRSKEVMPTKSPPEAPEEASALSASEFLPPFASLDLSRVLIEPTYFVKPLSPEATERTLYVYDVAGETYLPLVTTGDVPPGTSFGGKASANSLGMEFLGASPDLSHVVFTSPYALTPGALEEKSSIEACEGGSLCTLARNLYEWSAGHLHPVNVLPNGQPILNAFLGQSYAATYRGVQHPISNDGRWVVWTHEPVRGEHQLYVRDTGEGEERTLQVGGERATFETMSADGSRLFYLEGQDLYLFETATGVSTDVTAVHGAGESNAGVQNAVLGASQDGSYVYFVATGELTGSQTNSQGAVAQAGQPNLYLLHDTGSGWTTRYVATLSGQDEHSWSALDPETKVVLLQRVSSRVSPNGRFAAFMSSRPLTGYDNHDAKSGAADEEVFLYDAAANGGEGKLVCASCNPTGARPHGLLDNGERLMDPSGNTWAGHWVAASMTGWRAVQAGRAIYQPRNLSDSGRLFFESSDSLVPQDSNGVEDVYEYEPPQGDGAPPNDTCTAESPSFSPRSAGCVSLISSGTSKEESAFYDASESGNDTFFLTHARLVPADVDAAGDVYDAHVCTSESPCPPPPSPPAPECEGDACHGPASVFEDPTPGSFSFQGSGNVLPATPAAAPRPSSSTRSRKLARSLKACRKKKSRGKRIACERQARKRYGAGKSSRVGARHGSGR